MDQQILLNLLCLYLYFYIIYLLILSYRRGHSIQVNIIVSPHAKCRIAHFCWSAVNQYEDLIHARSLASTSASARSVEAATSAELYITKYPLIMQSEQISG